MSTPAPKDETSEELRFLVGAGVSPRDREVITQAYYRLTDGKPGTMPVQLGVILAAVIRGAESSMRRGEAQMSSVRVDLETTMVAALKEMRRLRGVIEQATAERKRLESLADDRAALVKTVDASLAEMRATRTGIAKQLHDWRWKTNTALIAAAGVIGLVMGWLLHR